MTEKQITHEQRRLTSLVTASEPTRSFEHSLRKWGSQAVGFAVFFRYYSTSDSDRSTSSTSGRKTVAISSFV
jgi:hypothetical protein